MALRRLGSKSVMDLKSEQNLKSLIRGELKDLINDSVHEYLKKNRIPVATIDINVDKDCNHCSHPGQRESSQRSVRLNITTASMDALPLPESHQQSSHDNQAMKGEVENLHWMTWQTNDETPLRSKSKNIRNYRSQTPISGHKYRCSSPFVRPNTEAGYGPNTNGYKEEEFRYRPCSIEPRGSYRHSYSDKVTGTTRPKTSVAVGPDKHYEERGTNTQKSYQMSDYLKKNMNLDDPYERNVYSSLMEVMRKKTHHPSGIDSEPGNADPVIQISEYKYRFQQPRTKIAFPTSNTQAFSTIKKPPICPQKYRPLGQLREPKPRFGEQFLF